VRRRGGKHAGLTIEDARRNVILRNLRIEANQEVGLQASNSLVAGFNLSITGNGIAGVGLSETAYLRCDDCTIADNPGPGRGFGVVGSAGALATLIRGSISARFPLSFRFSSVADAYGTALIGDVALDARGSAQITEIELRNSQQIFNPASGGNVVSGASQLTATAGSMLIGETVFDEFSNGIFSQESTLESLDCATSSDAICAANVSKSSSTCWSCP
jgi:hypothetical protein